MINIEGGEKYNLPEKACPNYGGEWNDKKEVCKIEDDEEKAAYEDYVCEEPEDSVDIQKYVNYGYLKIKIKKYFFYRFDGISLLSTETLLYCFLQLSTEEFTKPARNKIAILSL